MSVHSPAVINPSADVFKLMSQLPSNTVNCVFQDSYGLLWFGTKDGICRFDGYRLQTFRSNPLNPNLLPNNDVLAINETRDYYIIGTRKGACALYKRTMHMVKLEGEDLNNYEIRSIVTDRDGHIWIGTYKRVVRLSADLKECVNYDKKGLPITSCNYIYKDKNGNIWTMFWRKGLYVYNRAKDTFTKMPKVGNDDNPFRIIQDRDNRYWISTWNNGFFCLNRNRQGHYVISRVRLNGDTRNESRNAYGIVQDDKEGLLWMVGSNGCVTARPIGGNLEILDNTPRLGSLGDWLNSITQDTDGGLWLTSESRGLYYVNLNMPPVERLTFDRIETICSLPANIVSFCMTPTGEIWLSQYAYGLGLYGRAGNMVFARDLPNFMDPKKIGNIENVFIPSFNKNVVWAAPKYFNKIIEIRKQGNAFTKTRIYDLDDIEAGNPLTLFEDRNGNVWLATHRKIVVKPIGKNFQSTGLKQTDVYSITQTRDGAIWLASLSEGLIRVQPRLFKGMIDTGKPEIFNTANSPLTTNHVSTVFADNKRGTLWVGTSEGMILTYNQRTRQFTDLTDIFKSYIANELLNIVVDDHGYVWIVTTKKLIKYNPATRAVNTYPAGEHWSLTSFNRNSYFINHADGCIYFGGNGGIMAIDSRKPLFGKRKNNLPIVSDIKVNGLSVTAGAIDDTDYTLDNTRRHITLGSDARNIEIDLTSCNYENPGNIIYAYRLEGVDRGWNYTTSGRVFAYYNNLKKGKYKLQIKATDANGQWNEKAVTEYTVYRKPAFYETWWAYTLYILGILALAYWSYCRAKSRMKLREELHIAQIEKQKEDELTQTKLRYFTNVSHDFLTPITVISCIIDDMKMTYSSKLPQLDRILANLRRLKMLIQQVLDFRKMENGGMSLQVSEGDLCAFIQKICAEYLEPMMQKKGLRFSFNTDLKTLPAWFDADKVEKILTNLLSNAYKYTDRGEIEVTLSTNGNNAVISVKDTGKGMTEQELQNIFKRFYTVKTQRESNGIGLSLVKDLTTIHHASIDVSSKPGEGTTFTVTLPIDRTYYADSECNDVNSVPDVKDLATGAVELLLAPADSQEADERTVLIVEDNDELRHLMVGIFSRYHRVVEAADGEEALRKIREQEPDIVISDVMMPVMDGLELCRRLKNDIETSHIPVILLTARSSAADRVECYNAGADGYIAKPFELNVLKARIDNFLRLKEQKQQEFKTDTDTEPEKLKMSTLDKSFIDSAIALIDQHLDDDSFDVNGMSEKLCMSKSSLYRKIKSISGLSPVEFIRNIRLKRAYKMLKESGLNVTEVAYKCGFTTPRYFSTCFKAEFGITPTDFKKNS